jgi:hypothetical protein
MRAKPSLYRRGTLLEQCRKPWVNTIPCARTMGTRNHGSKPWEDTQVVTIEPKTRADPVKIMVQKWSALIK